MCNWWIGYASPSVVYGKNWRYVAIVSLIKEKKELNEDEKSIYEKSVSYYEGKK